MNIYEKLSRARAELKSKGLKMSGKNSHVGYEYFDLADILPQITEIEMKNKMLSVVRFGIDMATLTVYNAENAEEYIEFTSPMSTADLKGCHAVQNLGAVQTYIRRYLYLSAYEIVEAEMLDRVHGKDYPTKEVKTQKQETSNKPEQQSSSWVMELQDAQNIEMSFGRYKGERLGDIQDESYLKWLAESAMAEDVRRAAKIILNANEAPQIVEIRETLQSAKAVNINDGDLPF